MDVHFRRLAQKTMDSREIQIFAPVANRRASKNYLRNMFRAHKLRYGIGNTSPLQPYDLRPKALRETQVRRERVLIRFPRPEFTVHMKNVEFSIHAPGHARPTRD